MTSHRRPVRGRLVTALALVALGSRAATLVATARPRAANAMRATRATSTATVPPGYNYDFPRAITYRTVSNDPQVQCDQSDQQFLSELASEHLLGYTAYVTDAEPGTCERRKAEQLKRLFPQALVIWRTDINGGPPSLRPGTWPGYYLLMNRSSATAIPTPSQTSIQVVDPTPYAPGDTAIMWEPAGGDPFGNAEYIAIKSVTGNTLTVQRAHFGTAKTFSTPPYIAAIQESGPRYNLSTLAPKNPANGKTALQWLVDQVVQGFAPDQGQPTLDGVEFDATAWFPPVGRTEGTTRNLDCDDDGTMDFCDIGAGTPNRVDAFGLGWYQIFDLVRSGLQQYKQPGQPPKLAIGDQGARAVAHSNGAEFESFPSQDNYNQSSAAYSDLELFAKNAVFPKVSYPFTKDITPAFGSPSRQNPDGCVPPPVGTCSNSAFRYGLAASLMTGTFHAMADEDNAFTSSTPFDEQGGTIDTDVTGLDTGYLGQPTSTAIRQTRYTSGILLTRQAKQGDPRGFPTVTLPGWSGAVSQDSSVEPPGATSPSIRIDVNDVPPAAASTGFIVKTRVTSSFVANEEYTVSMWVRTAGAVPEGLHQVIARLDGGVAQQNFRQGDQWRHIFLQFRTTASVPTPYLSFQLGAETGQYWINDLRVMRGTAGIITRQYQNGIAVMNDSPFTQTSVPLPGGTYRKIAGVQDPVVNDGSRVGSTLPSIGGKDGIVLLREMPYATTPDIHVSDTSVTEGDAGTTDASSIVTLHPPASGPTTISYRVVGGTATAGEDFTAVSGSITIAQGDAAGRIDVPIRGDRIAEPNETLQVQITGVDRSATLSDPVGNITIVDDDGPPSVAAGPATIVEGTGGNTTASVPVTLSSPSGFTVTASYQLQGVTATAGSDFVAASGNVTFAPGATSASIPVQVIGDATAEGSEEVDAVLTGATNATIDASGRAGPLTIVDDDGAPRFAIGDVRIPEGTGNATVTVLLAPAAKKSVSVAYSTSDGTAKASSDYQTTSGTLTFLAGTTTRTFTVPIVDDAVHEGTEQLDVTLGTVSGATTQRKKAAVTIVDDDPVPSVSLLDAIVVEGTSSTDTIAPVGVTLSAPSALPVTLTIGVNDNQAKENSDYDPPPPKLVIPAGQTTATIPTPVTADSFIEGYETFDVRIVKAVGADIDDGIGKVTIIDDDGTIPRVSIDDPRVEEGGPGPAGTATFTVRVLPPSSQNVTFTWAAQTETAVSASDFAASSGTGMIPAGSTTTTLSVPVLADTLDEPDETFTVQLSNVTGAQPVRDLGRATIVDDDPEPVVSISGPAAPVTEGTGTGGTALVHVALSAPSGFPVTVDLDSVGGTATPGSDYVPLSTTVVIPPGTTGVDVPVSIVGDSTPEPTETIVVAATNPLHAALGAASATIQIADDD
jgi:hypothetical protein